MSINMRNRKDLHLYTRIGSNYNGPPLDRPALRRLPIDWKLTLERRPIHWYAIRSVVWTAVIALVMWAAYVTWQAWGMP